jgi:hypothetical protein
MKQSFYENEFVEYWMEEGIIIQSFKPNLIKINISIAKNIVLDRSKLTKGIKMPMLVDTNKGIAMDKESRDFFASEESLSDLRAVALLLHNPIAYLASQLFLVMNRPKVKFEFFNDRDKAFKWLTKYKN